MLSEQNVNSLKLVLTTAVISGIWLWGKWTGSAKWEWISRFQDLFVPHTFTCSNMCTLANLLDVLRFGGLNVSFSDNRMVKNQSKKK